MEKRQKEVIIDKKETTFKISSKNKEKDKKSKYGKRGESDEEGGFLLEKTPNIDDNENEFLRYDGEQIDKNKIRTLINTKVKDCIKQKFERIRDNNETLTARFKQNEIPNTNILNQTQQNVGAVQIKIFAAEIVEFNEVNRKKMRKLMYTKTFRIS